MSELDTSINSLMSAINGLTDIDDNMLTDELLAQILDNIKEQFSPALKSQSINEIIKNLSDQEATKKDALEALDALKETMREMIYGEKQYAGNKKILVDTVAESLFNIFDEAAAKYHSYSIELPMTVAPGAIVPTYAHDTDAAADLYALETKVLPAHSYGNMIRSGIHIQLPEGWLALILPRSSMGLKTPLRLSNSVGLIDSGYRGELGIIYDNTSDNDYTVNAGDRVAQLLVMPSHRFQAKVVDVLTESDRGEGGFGASGK